MELATRMRAPAPISTALKPSPMRGRGTALAVDEVPTRTPDFVVSLSISFDSEITAKLSLALTRGAGECIVSVGSRCPRLESVRRGKPLQPTPAGVGLRPAGAREGEHPPAVRQRQRFARRELGNAAPDKQTNAPLRLR